MTTMLKTYFRPADNGGPGMPVPDSRARAHVPDDGWKRVICIEINTPKGKRYLVHIAKDQMAELLASLGTEGI